MYAGFTTIDVRSLEDAVVRYGVAQALMDGLASTEEGLAVRDILPDLDFSLPQDVAKLTTLQREWIQPASGQWNGTQANTQVEVYDTSKGNTNNDQKVLIIYGLRLVNTGPARFVPQLCTSSIVFRRAAVKTIDIWQIEMLETVPDQVVYGRTPLLYKKTDSLRIDFVLRRAANTALQVTAASGVSYRAGQLTGPNADKQAGISGQNDFIMILGKVIEKIGDNVTG